MGSQPGLFSKEVVALILPAARCFTLLVFWLFLFGSTANAARIIGSAELDGSASGVVVVNPSATITAQVFVQTTGSGSNNDWESTMWSIAGAGSGCVDHGDHTNRGNYDEIFNIMAPGTDGLYDVEFIAYNNDNCTSGASTPYVRQIEVIPPYPSINTITLAGADPTTANMSVGWTVEFSETVTGVDAADFVLVESGGVTGSRITSVSGSGGTWTVTANTGTADTGTLGLTLVDNDTIVNSSGYPLAGPGSGNGDYVGPVYSLVPALPVLNKSASTSAATVGDVVTFTISVSNPYADPFTDIVVTDVIPTGMSYVTHITSAGSVNVSGQTLTWNIGNLPGSSSVQLTLAVSLSQQGTFINTVTSPGADPASATVLVLASAVTHFRMDEPVGSWTGAAGEVIDSGGTALHGRRLTSSSPTATNVVDPSPSIDAEHSSVIGSFCNAAFYDGNAVVQVADSVLFDYTTQLSASAWIYPTAYPPSEYYSILSNDVNYEFHLNSSGQLYWWWQASTLTSAATIPLNQWTHVAITLDSSPGVRRQRIYINGVLDSHTNNWQGTLATNNCNFHIGGDVDTGSCNIINGRNFHGMIDEVKLYGFEMTQEEVLADMRLGRSCSGSFDHIRIEHDGVASICAPERVTIKACMDSSCSALYPGEVTVNLSPSGWTGGDTFSFSGGIASRQLARGIAGDVILGTNSIAPTPAGSTLCYNDSVQSCTLNFADVSCAFDAVEPGALPQTPLYTKLSGVSFSLDVLALLDATNINTDYVNTVSVDLVDATTSACPTGAGLTSTTDIAFTLADSGRKPLAFNYPDAARNVKVRVRAGASAPACSTDNFAIRPQSFSISSSSATNTELTGTPILVAGLPFDLTATALPGYTGTPEIDPVQLTGSPIAGILSGSFGPATAGFGSSTGSDFRYTEVGHFGLNQNAVYDDSFTSVDQPDDCYAGFGNSLSTGRYGCAFGSVDVPLIVGNSGFGRFVPARFLITDNSPRFQDACGGVFTYIGQPFTFENDPQLTVIAVNEADEITNNYGLDYWRLGTSLSGRSYTNNASTTLGINVVASGSVIWSGTDDSDGTGIAALNGVQLSYEKLTVPHLPFDVDVDLDFAATDLTDADGVCYDPENDAVCNEYSIGSITGTEQRFGRLQLQNAYGPETLALSVPLQAEYYLSGSFIANADDDCTALTATTHLQSSSDVGTTWQAGNLPVAVGGGTTTPTLLNSPLTGGDAGLSYSAPGAENTGEFLLRSNISTDYPWLLFDWNGDGSADETSARVTFGIFNGNPRLIYMRESIW